MSDWKLEALRQSRRVAVLTEEESVALINSVERGYGDDDPSPEDIEIILEWADKTKIGMALIGLMTKDGDIETSVRDGEVVFFAESSKEESEA